MKYRVEYQANFQTELKIKIFDTEDEAIKFVNFLNEIKELIRCYWTIPPEVKVVGL